MDQQALYTIASLVIAYLLGSLPTALVISAFQGLKDPRSSGSGNAGATNMLRLYGKAVAILTLAGDIFKGFLVVWCYQHWVGQDVFWITLVSLSVTLGHIYPIFFQFKGGKGVATILGTMLAASPVMALFTLFCWVSALLITRVSAQAAITAAIISPAVAWIISDTFTPLWIACSAILIFSHRSNIRQLINSKRAFKE